MKYPYSCEDIVKIHKEYESAASAVKEDIGFQSKSNNVVSIDRLRSVQLQVMDELKDFLRLTFGPMGSNTMILRGNSAETIVAEYSKDGHKVLKNIKYSDPIEMTIQSELVDITHHVEKEVGDGTTSAVQLSAIIFRYMNAIMKKHADTPPYVVIRTFKNIVSKIQEEIKANGTDIDIDDIFNICMISTNGDEEISNSIVEIYKKYGFDVDVTVGISNTTDTLVKEYDGQTINEGYSDPAYVNNMTNGTCEIHNPCVYAFDDPIDTPNMVSLFEKIIKNNILDPVIDGDPYIPTVIVAPKISRDMSAMMESIIQVMYQYKGTESQKPPLLIISEITGVDSGVYHDIAKMCGCKFIRKYIDPELQKADEAKGLAANLDNVCSFCGEAELVISDMNKTKFINPKEMYEKDEFGNSTGKISDTYNMLINFIEAELASAKANSESIGTVNVLKKRLKALKGNIIDYLVGGITIADRDSKKDLVEDAIKNCSSACANGVGHAANFEGFRAANIVADGEESGTLGKEIAEAILAAYYEVAYTLYNSISTSEEMTREIIDTSLEKGMPMNLYTGKFNGDVLCSIMTDVKILEAISKIITIMVTSNQCIVQAPQLNRY